MVFGDKRKQVTFSLDNPEERRAFEFANTINFSKFVKEVLIQELRRQQQTKHKGSDE